MTAQVNYCMLVGSPDHKRACNDRADISFYESGSHLGMSCVHESHSIFENKAFGCHNLNAFWLNWKSRQLNATHQLSNVRLKQHILVILRAYLRIKIIYNRIWQGKMFIEVIKHKLLEYSAFELKADTLYVDCQLY